MVAISKTKFADSARHGTAISPFTSALND